MKNETFVSASTLVNKIKHKSDVTIDWSGMTEDDLQALAQRSIVIRKQNADRQAGIIPPESYRLLATDFKIGARVPKQAPDIKQLMAALSEEERANLIAPYLNK